MPTQKNEVVQKVKYSHSCHVDRSRNVLYRHIDLSTPLKMTSNTSFWTTSLYRTKL